jgi:hypothetical protein
MIWSIDRDEQSHRQIGLVLEHSFASESYAQAVRDDINLSRASIREHGMHECGQERNARGSAVRDPDFSVGSISRSQKSPS